jgi:glucosamine--fructose-6-phosphate aminotransferase (isomerizing)
MGGIVGMISHTDVIPKLVESMGRIPYHASDSCGVASLNSSTIEVRKGIGPLQEVSRQRGFNQANGRFGIAHIGKLVEGSKISRKNAQPHLSCDGKFAVVNDGTISNSQRLRANLETTGRHFFFSDAGAEVFAHLMEEAYWVSHSVEQAFAQALQQIEGDFAVAVISNCESPRIFCAHNKKPLLIGTEAQRTFVSSNSDMFQFDPNYHHVPEEQYAVLSADGYSLASISHGDNGSFDLGPLFARRLT